MFSKLKIVFKNENKYKERIFVYFMVKKEVLQTLLDQKKISVLRVVLFAEEELNLKEIVQNSNVPLASTFRILQVYKFYKVLEKRVSKSYKVLQSLTKSYKALAL